MFLGYLTLWGSVASEPQSQETVSIPTAEEASIPSDASSSTNDAVRSQNYWQDLSCPATYAHTTIDKTTAEITMAISAAKLLTTLGPANSPANLDVIENYLNSNNPCLIGAGIAIVKATGEAALTPAIKSQLNKIATQYKTSEPWLAAAAAELLK